MRWSTTAETYGDFIENRDRIYLTQLPVLRRWEHVQRLRRLTDTSASEYGSFYERGAASDRYPSEYAINRSFYLPPIKLHAGGVLDRRDSPAGRRASRDPLRLNLEDIRDVDIELNTYDNQTAIITPSSFGVGYKTMPYALSHVRLPDIRNVNITLRQTDGSVLKIPSKCNMYS